MHKKTLQMRNCSWTSWFSTKTTTDSWVSSVWKIRSSTVIHISHFTYSWHHFPARYLTRPGRLSVIEWRTRKLLSTVRIETTCLVYHLYLHILKVHIGYESITFIQFIHIHNLHHLHPISVVCEVVHILRLKIQHCKTETEIVCLIKY